MFIGVTCSRGAGNILADFLEMGYDYQSHSRDKFHDFIRTGGEDWQVGERTI